MPLPVVELLASMAKCSKEELYADIVKAGAVQHAYIQERVRPIRELPWKLARGSKATNLDDLLVAGRPREETAAKIYDLANGFLSPADIHAGMALLGEANFSTLCVEQGHKIASKLQRGHPLLQRRQICGRSFLFTAMVLFNEDPLQRSLRAVQVRIARQKRKRPHASTGRHVFLKR